MTQPATHVANIAHRAGLPRRVLAMATLALLLIVLLAVAVFSTAQRYRSDLRWTLHSYQVREQALQLVNQVHVAEMKRAATD